MLYCLKVAKSAVVVSTWLHQVFQRRSCSAGQLVQEAAFWGVAAHHGCKLPKQERGLLPDIGLRELPLVHNAPVWVKTVLLVTVPVI